MRGTGERGLTLSAASAVARSTGAAADACVRDYAAKPKTTLSVDITGSFANSVVGLFKDEFSGTGYTNGGSRCGLGSAVAPQLMGTLDPGQYYVVITGTTAAASGVRWHNVRFDATHHRSREAFTMKNDDAGGRAQQSHRQRGRQVWHGQGLGPDQAHADRVGAGDPDRHGARGTDDNDVNAFSLGQIQDKQVIVVTNASTIDLAADYPAGTCMPAGAVAGPDALYSFTVPSMAIRMQVSLHDSQAGRVKWRCSRARR